MLGKIIPNLRIESTFLIKEDFSCSSKIIQIIFETDFEPKISKNQAKKPFSKSRKIWMIVTILIELIAQKSASPIKNLFYAKVYYFTA